MGPGEVETGEMPKDISDAVVAKQLVGTGKLVMSRIDAMLMATGGEENDEVFLKHVIAVSDDQMDDASLDIREFCRSSDDAPRDLANAIRGLVALNQKLSEERTAAVAEVIRDSGDTDLTIQELERVANGLRKDAQELRERLHEEKATVGQLVNRLDAATQHADASARDSARYRNELTEARSLISESTKALLKLVSRMD